MTGILAHKRLDIEGARAIFTKCVKDHANSSSVDKCSKGLNRTSLAGRPAPALDVETWINGSPVDLAAQKGKVVLLWFFATWCPHCKEAMPNIADMSVRFADQGLVVVGVTANTKGQTTESAASFVKTGEHAADFTYSVAVDRGQATTEAFDATGIPQAVLVDRKGIIRWTDHPVFLSDDMVEKLLAEK